MDKSTTHFPRDLLGDSYNSVKSIIKQNVYYLSTFGKYFKKQSYQNETLTLAQKVFHTIVFTYKRSYHAMNFRSCVARKALNFLTTFVLLICTLISENQCLEKSRADCSLSYSSFFHMYDLGVSYTFHFHKKKYGIILNIFTE